MKSVTAGAACVLLLWSPSAAGASGETDEPITRVTVNQVRIDAVVTDSKGNLVRDVPSDDFQVFQDGKRQAPIHVQYVAGAPPSAPAGNHELKASEVKRTIVILLDDEDMSFASFHFSRRATQQYLDQAMQPGDLVAVLRTTETSSYLNPFTSDPAAVRLTIAQMRYHAPFITWDMATIPLLRSVLSALDRMPGRKSLIVFSDHMSMPMSTEGPDAYRRLADSALRSAVRIYGIGSRGLSTGGPISGASRAPQGADASVSRSHDARQGSGVPLSTARTSRLGDLDGLRFLAEETGGLMMANNVSVS
jgi:VWFA-related protein